MITYFQELDYESIVNYKKQVNLFAIYKFLSTSSQTESLLESSLEMTTVILS